MFEHTSRYYGRPPLSYKRPDRRVVSYAPRRILPQPDSLATLVEARITAGDRLDRLAAATLGDPLLFWQICDANGALDPFDLTTQVGGTIKVPRPGAPPA
jgi:hypothetical protein